MSGEESLIGAACYAQQRGPGNYIRSRVPPDRSVYRKLKSAWKITAQIVFNVERWSEMRRGDHFAAIEEPQLLAEDLRTWFRPFCNP